MYSASIGGSRLKGERQMLLVWSANLKEGMDIPYKKWAMKNIGEMKRRIPKGWKLVGGYGAAMNLGPRDVVWIWEFNRYKDMDDLFDLVDPVLDKMSAEENKFLLPGSIRSMILRNITDWYEPVTKKSK